MTAFTATDALNLVNEQSGACTTVEEFYFADNTGSVLVTITDLSTGSPAGHLVYDSSPIGDACPELHPTLAEAYADYMNRLDTMQHNLDSDDADRGEVTEALRFAAEKAAAL